MPPLSKLTDFIIFEKLPWAPTFLIGPKFSNFYPSRPNSGPKPRSNPLALRFGDALFSPP
jgi:hypothetical protein